jgi:phosphoribosylamine--glycine ligase
MEIAGLDRVRDSLVFHSGTAINAGRLVAAGGRVLAVTALGHSLGEAQRTCYRNTAHIEYSGKRHRSDIGADLTHLENPSAHV